MTKAMMSVAIDNEPLRVRRSETSVLWRRALLAWVIMAVAMSLNGIFRVKVLAPRWGDVWAGVASAASGIALIQLIARQAMHAEVPPSSRQRMRIASLWLLLTIAFEFTFGHYVDSKSWSELFDNYNLLQGHLWPVVLASLVCAPFLWERAEKT
jgi:hypothetical protein